MAARIRPTDDEPRTRLKQVSLWSPTRLAMLDAIASEPGICVIELARRIGRNQATVWSHMHILQQAGLVNAEREGRKLRLFAAGAVTPEARFRAKLGSSAAVFDAVARGVPGRPIPIAHECGITRHAARSQLRRLARLGLVRREEVRRVVTESAFRLVRDDAD